MQTYYCIHRLLNPKKFQYVAYFVFYLHFIISLNRCSGILVRADAKLHSRSPIYYAFLRFLTRSMKIWSQTTHKITNAISTLAAIIK